MKYFGVDGVLSAISIVLMDVFGVRTNQINNGRVSVSC
jgi:hypothetical protein